MQPLDPIPAPILKAARQEVALNIPPTHRSDAGANRARSEALASFLLALPYKNFSECGDPL
jgi:hypothetical protein